jgi:RHS repeat-associated protein
VELGLKFRSDVNGFITGVRFYKGGAANGGTHVGHLWASDGTLLGSVTFANETASGWQQALFQNPIAITANTTYVVSYFAPQGNYAADNNYFASSGVDNALLHALSNAVAGGNGIFHYDAAGGFPADSFASTNYWVDVVFNDSASLPPRVLSVTPAAGATGVSIDVAPAAMFSKALDATSVGTSTVLLRDASNNPVSVTTSYAASTFTVTLTPQQPLQPGQTYTVTLKGGSAAPHITDSVGTPLASDYTWSFTTAPAAPPNGIYSIWSPAATPGTPLGSDGQAVELGLKFRSDISGFIAGVRFYKGGAANGGTHVGHLWASDGTLLSSVTFANETASGWQQALFQNPVPITANTTYVVSYFAPQGNYAGDNNYFATSGVDNAPLHALSNAASGGNGVYLYGATGGFPADTFSSLNYWVDVAFTLLDTAPPTVTAFSPAAGATNVNVNANITLTFSEAMDASTVSGSTLELRDPSNALIPATVSYNAASFTATLDPTSALSPGMTYTAHVRGGGADPRVKDLAGNALAADTTWTFTTAQTGGIKWLVTDHLGSTRMVVDQSGSLAGIERHDYLPFGEDLAGVGIRNSINGYGGDLVRQKFTGDERDDETKLDFAQSRYYSSIQGRFTRVDSFEPVLALKGLDLVGITAGPQAWNKYSYAYNNPLKYVDGNGKIGHILAGIAAGAIIGAGFEIFREWAKGEKLDPQKIGAAALGGGIAGGLAALTGGASLGSITLGVVENPLARLGIMTGANILGGMAERAADGDSATDALDPDSLVLDGITGVAGNFFGDWVAARYMKSAMYYAQLERLEEKLGIANRMANSGKTSKIRAKGRQMKAAIEAEKRATKESVVTFAFISALFGKSGGEFLKGASQAKGKEPGGEITGLCDQDGNNCAPIR